MQKTKPDEITTPEQARGNAAEDAASWSGFDGAGRSHARLENCEMLKLQDFGQVLRSERTRIGDSVAKFAKETAGISKNDVHDFEEGKRVPDKLTLKKLFHCFPILMQFEHDLRHGNFEAPSEIRQLKPKRHAAPQKEPTRLQPPPRQQRPLALAPAAKPRLEIVRQHELPPEVLTQPLAPTLVQALRKTRVEMLSDLAGMVKKRLGNHTAEDHDFTIRNDGKQLVVKLQVDEGDVEDELVDSGCYVTVGPRDPGGLRVFCKTMTGGNCSDIMPRLCGVSELLGIAKMLHDAVKDRRFD